MLTTHLFRADVRNEWSYSSTLPLCFHGVAGITVLFYSIQLVRKQCGHGLSMCFGGSVLLVPKKFLSVFWYAQYKFTTGVFNLPFFLTERLFRVLGACRCKFVTDLCPFVFS